MKLTVNQNELELMVGDITKQPTDVIVNAANGTLLGGGGVDGAIHRAAGEQLLEECKQIRQEQLDGKKLPTGDVVITKGYQLRAKHVIHTVGPVWQNNHNQEDERLAACYHNALQLAKHHQLTSISFPSISTGVYRFPVERAATIAIETIYDFLQEHDFGQVVMTLFSEDDYQAYEKALNNLL